MESKLKLHFAVIRIASNEKVAYRDVIAHSKEYAIELVYDYIGTNWGTIGEEGEYSFEIITEQEIETGQASNVY